MGATPSALVVLNYGRSRGICVADVLGIALRLAIVAVSSLVIGLLLAWLTIPRYYVDGYWVRPIAATVVPAPGGPGNVMNSLAAQLESPGFINASAAPLLAKGTIAASDPRGAAVHAAVDRKSGLIVVSVSHRDADVAEALSIALMAATQGISAPGVQSFNIVQTPLPARLLDARYPPTARWTLVALWILSAIVLCVYFRRRIFTISAYAI